MPLPTEFTHDMIVRKRSPGDPPADISRGSGTVIWAAWTDEDVLRFPSLSPSDLYQALKNAEDGDRAAIRDLLSDMERPGG